MEAKFAVVLICGIIMGAGLREVVAMLWRYWLFTFSNIHIGIKDRIVVEKDLPTSDFVPELFMCMQSIKIPLYLRGQICKKGTYKIVMFINLVRQDEHDDEE